MKTPWVSRRRYERLKDRYDTLAEAARGVADTAVLHYEQCGAGIRLGGVLIPEREAMELEDVIRSQGIREFPV